MSETTPTAPDAGQPSASEPTLAPAADTRPLAGDTGSFARRLLANVPTFWGLPPALAGLLGVVVILASFLLAVEALGLVLTGMYRAFGELLPIVILSAVVAYLFDPIIDRFEGNSWTRSFAILICLGIVVGALAVVSLVLVPYVVEEVGSLSENIGVYLQRIGEQATSLQHWLEAKLGRKLPLELETLQTRLPELLPYLRNFLNPLGDAARGLAGSSFHLLGSLIRWSLFPVLTFFFLRDWDTLKRGCFELLPMRYRRGAAERWVEIDQKLSSFVRGQITVCLILAVLYAAGLVVFTDVPLGGLIGVLSGLLFIVPYLGTFLGIVAGSILAALAFGASWEIVKVWVVFAVVQGFEGTVLTPKIVGDSVGLHPVVVILALFVGGGLFGFLGILLAVPAAAVAMVLAEAGLRRARATAWFQEGAADAPPSGDLR